MKGIDPKAREIAKDLARRSGMTLGEWLNQMIIEGEPEAPPMAREPDASRFDPRREPPRPEPQRPVLQAPRRTYEPEFDRTATEEELDRITRALEAFSNRLEAAEHRSTLAISGIDQSVMGVLSRMDGIERDQTSIGARFEGSLDEVRAAQGRLADKLRRMEQEDGPRVEAMKALEASLGKVAAQIYEGESRARGSIAEVRQDLSGLSRRLDRLDVEIAGKAEAGDPYTHGALVDSVSRVTQRLEEAENRTTAAVQALESSFAGLDARLKSTETRLGPEIDEDSPEHRFQKLAAEMQEKVDAQRAEMAEHMRAAADGKLDRMEAALRDLAGHVESAEKQSAQAIDRMGREVMRIAQSLGSRVAAVETRNAESGDHVGGEMARIADAIENRMRTADAVQAEALEKLGGEIGRIAERLAERIAASERRAATAIDEVGDQVARVTDKINQRYDRAASELSERIKQSEERTAKLLEETRSTLDRRLIDTQRRNAIDAAVQAVEAPEARISDFDDGGFADDTEFTTPAAASAFNEDPFQPTSAPEPPRLDPPRFEAGSRFEPEPRYTPPEPAAFDQPPPSAYAPGPAESFDDFAPPPAQSGRSSTRDLIEAARAAARQASAPEARGRRGRGLLDDFTPSTPAPALEDAPRGLGAFLSGRKKKKEASTTLKTALIASGTAAALSMSVVGFGLINASHSKDDKAASEPQAVPQAKAVEAPPTSDADLLAAALTPEPATAPDAAAVSPAKPAAPPPAPAPAPAPAPTASAAVAAPAAPSADPKQIYSAAVQKIEGGDATGVDSLRRAANLGYAPAQFYLAKLHETGSAGVKKDPVEARRWTERAAAAGDDKAMHNLGLYYFEGTGGPKNATQAAAWFRKAADYGLKDSQYNLARLYEQGLGVAQNPAEAYKWYLIAAAKGDREARASAEQLGKTLAPEAVQAAQRSASAFRPQGPALAER